METVLRVGIIYVFILVVLRVLGKRELSQLSPMELVLLLLIPELVSQGLVQEDFSVTNAIVAVSTLIVLVFATSALSYRFKGVARAVEGSPVLLAERGQIKHEALDYERLAAEELLGEIRKAGIENLNGVKWAVLESDGKISVIGYSGEHQPPKEEQHVA